MKDMTPQEKLAARLELVAKRLDPDGPSVRDTPGLNSFAEITAEVRAIATALSEQGEVTTTTDASGRCVAVTRQDGEGRILSTIWEASEHGGGGEVGHAGYLVDGSYFYYADFPRSEWSKHNSVVPLYLHPPTPSAPVVDDAPIDDSRVTRQMAEAAQAAWERAVTEGLQMQLPAWSSLLPMRQAIAAALSSASAPVGVEGLLVVSAPEQKPLPREVQEYASDNLAAYLDGGTPAASGEGEQP